MGNPPGLTTKVHGKDTKACESVSIVLALQTEGKFS